MLDLKMVQRTHPNVKLATMYSLESRPCTSSVGPFALSHPDLGYHNFIVDDQYNLLAVIDWDGVVIKPIEFSATFPMELDAPHPIFWKGGRLDNERNRKRIARLEDGQRKYIAVMLDEIDAFNRIVECPQSLLVTIARGMVLYEQVNLGPWEWLVDILESKDGEGDGKDFQTLLRELQGIQAIARVRISWQSTVNG